MDVQKRKALTFPWRDAPSDAQFAVLGDPISHTLSPRIHEAAYRAANLDYRFVAIHATTEELFEALDHLRNLKYVGVNLTVPHKIAGVDWCHKVSEIARAIGSVNTIELDTRRGYSTDVGGFAKSLEGKVPSGPRSLVIGAGGSARAVIYALNRLEGSIFVYNRTPKNALAMIEGLDHDVALADSPRLGGYDLVVNATSSPLKELHLDWSDANSQTLAYDLNYGERAEGFLAPARLAGLPTMDGLTMLVNQAAEAYTIWLGKEPDLASMFEALKT